MNGRLAASGVAAVLAAAAISAPLVQKWEGWEAKPYTDVVGVSTVCAGATKGVLKSKTYSDRECMDLLARDLVTHGMEIDRCLPAGLPPETRAAFTSAAYNIGTGAFCGSSMARKAKAGDLKGACDALLLWNKAGGKVLKGLVARREEERAYCLRGLK